MNLGAPDKVILVDIYQVSSLPLPLSIINNTKCITAQTVCGFSVVPGDWDSLKRYNLTELYKQASTIVGGDGAGDAPNRTKKSQEEA